MTRLMGASGAESLNVAASIFMGQTEAPLTIRPFLNRMTQSELMCVMTAGMAHVSGSIMAAYIAFGVEAKHLLAAVIMTAPGTILLAKMLVPETETAGDRGHGEARDRARGRQRHRRRRARDDRGPAPRAQRRGHARSRSSRWSPSSTSCWATSASLVRRQAEPRDDPRLRLHAPGPGDGRALEGRLRHRRPAGHAHGPQRADRLLARSGAIKATLDPRTFTIATYALCGFANFSSIGIQIGGIGALAPERRGDLARLGLRALLAGTFANFMTACIAGALL